MVGGGGRLLEDWLVIILFCKRENNIFLYSTCPVLQFDTLNDIILQNEKFLPLTSNPIWKKMDIKMLL